VPEPVAHHKLVANRLCHGLAEIHHDSHGKPLVAHVVEQLPEVVGLDVTCGRLQLNDDRKPALENDVNALLADSPLLIHDGDGLLLGVLDALEL